jgi:tRNA dimethylallyltransferase
VRSLEIINTLGQVPEPVPSHSPYTWLTIGLTVDKDTLLQSFTTRLEHWLDRGLLEEVAAIRSRLSPERFLELGFEYVLTADYLDGQLTRAELFEQFKQKNWQYAKRQLTWLKRDSTIRWFQPTDYQQIAVLVQEYLQH